jgi:2-polyprenyl-3-methyl-5-hydroxy-6-metoxy-1,4-benzoquinol methylase
MASAVDGRAERIAALQYSYAKRAKEAVVSCNLCGSTEHAEAARTDRYGYPAILKVCTACGLGFLSPRMTAGEYADFYAHTYRPLVSAYHGRLIDAETVQDDQRGYTADLVEFLRGALPAPPETVVDVGGSTGVVAGGVAGAFGSRATVLDPSPDELAVAEASGMETIAGFAEDYDPKGRTWDLVLLCQTIDHLLDVSATLGALRRMLADDGRAFVDILDFELAMERNGLEGAVKIDHPYYLTRATAHGFFERAGFEAVAERLSDDGHWGLLVRGTEPDEPDRGALKAHADALLERIGAMREAS